MLSLLIEIHLWFLLLSPYSMLLAWRTLQVKIASVYVVVHCGDHGVAILLYVGTGGAKGVVLKKVHVYNTRMCRWYDWGVRKDDYVVGRMIVEANSALIHQEPIGSHDFLSPVLCIRHIQCGVHHQCQSDIRLFFLADMVFLLGYTWYVVFFVYPIPIWYICLTYATSLL